MSELRTPNLLIGDIPTVNTAYSLTLTDKEYTRLRHRKRWFGGAWELTFFIPETVGTGMLDEWYNTWLAYRIAEYAEGATPWTGVIWELSRTKDGAKQRRSLADVYNAVKCVYTTTSTTVQDDTAWQLNENSIARYMRREQIIWADNISLAQAEAEAQAFLNKHYDAWNKAINFNATGEEGLEVTAVGDARLFNNLFATVTDSLETIAVDAFVEDIFTGDIEPVFPFLNLGRIDPNTFQTQKEQRAPTRCGDLIDRLARNGDGTLPYRYYVDNAGLFHFVKFDATPTLEWRGKSRGGIYLAGGERVTWAAEPGVMVDRTTAEAPALPGSFLQKRNHTLIEQFSMWQGQEHPQPETEEPNEEQLLANMESFLRQQTDFDFDTLHTPDER